LSDFISEMEVYPGERLGIRRPNRHVTNPLNAGIESAESAIRPEVRTIPIVHQSENAGLDAPHPGGGVAREQMQFLELPSGAGEPKISPAFLIQAPR
jgi:hypothetical protein